MRVASFGSLVHCLTPRPRIVHARNVRVPRDRKESEVTDWSDGVLTARVLTGRIDVSKLSVKRRRRGAPIAILLYYNLYVRRKNERRTALARVSPWRAFVRHHEYRQGA